MNPNKEIAIELRQQGLSYTEISKELEVPKSTLSSWLKHIELSNEAATRLKSRVYQGTINGLIARNVQQTDLAQQNAAQIREQAKESFGYISENELRMIGTALYWAEGYKRPIVRDGREVTSHAISFVNADPAMIRMFIRYLIEILNVDVSGIRATMRLHTNIDEPKAKKYWLYETGLPIESFKNTTFQISKASKGERPFDRLPYGTLQIGVYKTEKFHEIIGSIEGMKVQAVCDIVGK
jgi:hypothetical protein